MNFFAAGEPGTGGYKGTVIYRTELYERAKLLQWWADRVDAMRKGADIIPFKAA